jgi:hypothetical protein
VTAQRIDDTVAIATNLKPLVGVDEALQGVLTRRTENPYHRRWRVRWTLLVSGNVGQLIVSRDYGRSNCVGLGFARRSGALARPTRHLMIDFGHPVTDPGTLG